MGWRGIDLSGSGWGDVVTRCANGNRRLVSGKMLGVS
jgi:hypothetical protein